MLVPCSGKIAEHSNHGGPMLALVIITRDFRAEGAIWGKLESEFASGRGWLTSRDADMTFNFPCPKPSGYQFNKVKLTRLVILMPDPKNESKGKPNKKKGKDTCLTWAYKPFRTALSLLLVISAQSVISRLWQTRVLWLSPAQANPERSDQCS